MITITKTSTIRKMKAEIKHLENQNQELIEGNAYLYNFCQKLITRKINRELEGKYMDANGKWRDKDGKFTTAPDAFRFLK